MEVGIIGVRGFVGSNLKAYLEARGVRIIGYTREVVDLCDASSLSRIGEHDVVVNCAAHVSGSSSTLFAANVNGLHNLCTELNQRERKPYLLQISSGAVYGFIDHAVDAMSTPAPVGNYALTKFLGDEIVRLSYRGLWGVARLYFPYGEGQDERRLLPRLTKQVLAGDTIEVSHQGRHPIINPIYKSDLCDKLHEMMIKNATGICLLGGGEVVSVAEIAQIIGRIADKKVVFKEVNTVSSNMFCQGSGRVMLKDGLARIIASL